MHWIDWMITLVPLVVVFAIGFGVKKYIKTVADFLTAGRVAGRYLISVSDGVTGLGIITMVSMFEMYYSSGNALGFWQNIGTPIALLITLSGFIIYRYRETRAMTLAQFFEIRYSHSFRIFAGLLIFFSGVLNYAIFPAVSGRFIVYYCRLPLEVSFLGFTFPTLGLVMAVFLIIALLIAIMGGMLTTMVTDCLQGLYSMIIYAVMTVAVLCMFTTGQLRESMLDREEGMSFFNPFDTDKMMEFNILFIMIQLFNMIYTHMALQGQQGYNCAGASPHEQKMGSILGTWRGGLTYLMIPLLAFCAYTYLNHPDFAGGAEVVQAELVNRINLGTEGVTNTIRTQMTVPVALRNILPVGLVGLFCSLAVFLLVSTDTTYMQSFGAIFIQDVVMPIYNKPISQKKQLMLLRLAIIAVAAFAWYYSMVFGISQFITMYFAMTSAIFLGGAGSCIIGGLYWKRGTTAGAWTALVISAVMGFSGLLIHSTWETHIYPYFELNNPAFLTGFGNFIQWISDACPLGSWSFSRERFPFTGREIMLLTSITCIISYITVSLLTCRKPFNLEKMLHRGKYNLEHKNSAGKEVEIEAPEGVKARKVGFWKSLKDKLLGINEEYTRGDRILAWSVLIWTLYNFVVWGVTAIWNLIPGYSWSTEFWFDWWRYYQLNQALLIGVLTTVWFLWGGSRDLIRLFKALKNMDHQDGDDGRVPLAEDEELEEKLADEKA